MFNLKPWTKPESFLGILTFEFWWLRNPFQDSRKKMMEFMVKSVFAFRGFAASASNNYGINFAVLDQTNLAKRAPKL